MFSLYYMHSNVSWGLEDSCYKIVEDSCMASVNQSIKKKSDLDSIYIYNTAFSLDPDPTQRINFWGLTFGVGLTCMGIYGSSQVGVQRYSALNTRRKANM